MAQQAPSTQAALTQGVDRAHFLAQTDRHGYKDYSASLGHNNIEHSVLVFGKEQGLDDKHTVVMSLRASGFSIQEYLTPEEASTLAKALLLAADYADAGQHLLSASQRQAAQEQAQQQADEVAA